MKIPSPSLVLLLAVWANSPLASADQFGDFKYNDDGTSITFTDYPESDTGPVVTPATIIGISAFKLSILLEEVNFKGKAPTLGTDAFSGNARGFHINFHNAKTGFTTPI